YEGDIYAQRFSSDGTALGSNFMVNVEPGDEEQSYPTVSMDSCGNFVIIWADEQSGEWDIYGQRYSFDGTPLDGNFKINDTVGNSLHYWPASYSYSNGNFIVSWVEQQLLYDFDIYAQRFLADGTPQGNNFKVNDDEGNSTQFRPDISIDDEGNSIIVWDDNRDGEGNIYAQRYSDIGATIGDNFNLNAIIPGRVQRNPSVSCEGPGNFVVSWEESGTDYCDVYARRYASDGTPLGDAFMVNDSIPGTYQYVSKISSDGEGDFLIIWEDLRFGFNGDIFAQSYQSGGTSAGENYRVNDDEGSENQWGPSIAKNQNDQFIVTWVDTRLVNNDIYAQRYLPDGSLVGSNFKVSMDTSGTSQFAPSIAMDSAGNFVLAWEDYRNGYCSEIWAQRFSGDGSALGENFKVNNAGASVHYGPKVVCKKNGDFTIAWGDSEDGALAGNHKDPFAEMEKSDHTSRGVDGGSQPDIYAQMYKCDGTTIGSNFMVNDNVDDTYQQYPAIAIDSEDNFIITWEDNRDGGYDIFFQRYLSNGTPLGSNVKIEDSLLIEYQRHPSISSDEIGNFVIAWVDNRIGNYDIWAQRFLDNGIPSGDNFMVNTDSGNSHQSSPCISVNEMGDFIITWDDRRNGNYDVYAQRYSSDGFPFGSNYRISNTGGMQQFDPVVILGDDRIFTCWQDNRGGQTGYDVWANVLEWGHIVGMNNFTISEIKANPQLFQNYPNPFNGFTTISYSLNEADFVT
nr:hypothetical protein [Bacteroidota bacterium]